MKLVISFADEASSKNLTEFLEMPYSALVRVCKSEYGI